MLGVQRSHTVANLLVQREVGVAGLRGILRLDRRGVIPRRANLGGGRLRNRYLPREHRGAGTVRHAGVRGLSNLFFVWPKSENFKSGMHRFSDYVGRHDNFGKDYLIPAHRP